MNVSLTDELEKFVSAKVESGRYNSASEVVREALRLLEEHDQDRARKLAEFNDELARRMDSVKNGNYFTAEQLRTHFKRKSEERRKAKS
jgi:antitoxin ParD1/3/4